MVVGRWQKALLKTSYDFTKTSWVTTKKNLSLLLSKLLLASYLALVVGDLSSKETHSGLETC